MVAGVDRYFQIARCLRDEDLRADRQYEFMQLDAEMSFVDQDDVLEAIGEAVLDAAEAVTGERPLPIPHITWHEAMDRYGVDKPDLRFGMELVELTKLFAATEFKAFAGAESIKGIRVPAMAEELGRSRLDALDRPRQAARRQGPGLDEGGRGGLARGPGHQVPVRVRAGRSVVGPRRGAGRRAAHRRRRVGHHLRGPRAAAQRPRPAAGARGSVPLRVGGRLPAVRRHRRGDGPAEARPPPLHPGAPRRRRPPRDRAAHRSAAAPTTWCSTGGSSAPGRSGSTSPSCNGASSTCSASATRRPTGASGSS